METRSRFLGTLTFVFLWFQRYFGLERGFEVIDIVKPMIDRIQTCNNITYDLHLIIPVYPNSASVYSTLAFLQGSVQIHI